MEDERCLRILRDTVLQCIQGTDVPPGIITMSSLRILCTLWLRRLRHNPAHPAWYGRDRFVMSAGMNAILQYAIMYLTGYPIPPEDMRRYRRLGSLTPGHPEAGLTPGVELTVGSFGEALAGAVGLAIAEKHQAARINTPGCSPVCNATYALLCDGDLQEGAAHEAASLAGSLGLGGLICLYDNSRAAAERAPYLSNFEDFRKRFCAYGWQVLEVEGTDAGAIVCALDEARADREHPSLVVVTETEDEGSLERYAQSAGPMPAGCLPELFRAAAARGGQMEAAWDAMARQLDRECPEKAVILNRAATGRHEELTALLPDVGANNAAASPSLLCDAVIAKLSAGNTNFFGGACLLFPAKGDDPDAAFTKQNPAGNVLRCGIREQALGAVMTGLARYGGLFVCGNNFLALSDYMRPSIRVAAMMRLNIVYALINDSVWNGQDGPTHQPSEQLATLRAVPGLTLIRPADAEETIAAWRFALSAHRGPVALALGKRPLPPLPRVRSCALEKGAYVLYESVGGFEIILMATGSEVADTLEAASILEAGGRRARVVSFPSWELFEAQTAAYRQAVLPDACRARLAVEAGVSMGWQRYIGDGGGTLSIDGFGLSAPYAALRKHFGFEPENIAEAALTVWRRCREYEKT